VLFVRARGVLVGGESVEEAFHLLRRVMNAVDTQVGVVLHAFLENLWSFSLNF